jgi:Glycosyltransferase family 87
MLSPVRWIALSAVVTIALMLTVSQPKGLELEFPDTIDGIRTAVSTLRADGIRSDFGADVIGARALVDGGSAYPVLGPAFQPIGLDWEVRGRNTHPPTAFLLALPVSWMDWPAASAAWGWIQVVLFGVALWALGLRWQLAVAFAPAWLLWPPGAWSLGQWSALWIACAALAYRWRDRPFLAGVVIAIAALPKLVPAVLLVPFLLRRQWGALAGFSGVIALAVGALAVLNPSTLTEYNTIGRPESFAIMRSADNGALLPQFLGTNPAVLLIAGVALIVGLAAWRRDSWPVWQWAAVALLPIAWVYSLIVLAPILVESAQREGAGRFFAGAAVALPLVTRPFGPDAPWVTTASIIAAGVCAVLLVPLRSSGDS